VTSIGHSNNGCNLIAPKLKHKSELRPCNTDFKILLGSKMPFPEIPGNGIFIWKKFENLKSSGGQNMQIKDFQKPNRSKTL